VDTGLGIPAEEQAQVFSKFFRSADAAVRAELGTGLGLNITKLLVELQGGEIWFESEHGVGTTFSFTVPVA
jgi:signal transduction histidine kinase